MEEGEKCGMCGESVDESVGGPWNSGGEAAPIRASNALHSTPDPLLKAGQPSQGHQSTLRACSKRPNGSSSSSSITWPHGPAAVAKRMAKRMFWDVIDPRGVFIERWDTLLVLQLVYLIVQVPYVVGFGISYGPGDALGIVEILIDITFGVDVYLNFRTGYPDPHSHHIIMKRRAVVRHYLRTWFAVDLVSAFPYEWLVFGEAGLIQLVKTMRMFKIVRFLRLVKLVKMSRRSMLMHRTAHALGPNLMRLLKLILAGAALTHVVTCSFYWASSMGSGGSQDWVRAYGAEDRSNTAKYVTSLYFTVSTLGTVGYGDVRAVTTAERILAIVAILLGLTVFASFVSSVSHLLGTMDGKGAKARRKIQQLDSFLGERQVPRSLARRIATFHRQTTARQRLSPEEVQILNELSVPLRTELVMFLYRSVLERIPFFHGKGGMFISAVVTHLRLECLEAGDIVMQQGDSGDHMYFVADGRLEARLYHGQKGQNKQQQQQPSLDGIAEELHPASSTGTADRAAWDETRSQGRQHVSYVAAEDCTDPSTAAATAVCRVRISLPPGHVGDNASKAAAAPSKGGRRASGAVRPPGGWGDYRVMGVLGPGEYFGEYSTLLGRRRTHTVVALAPCELYSLSRQSLEALLVQWPELVHDFESMLQVYPCEGGLDCGPGGVLGRAPHSEGMATRRAQSRLWALSKPAAGHDSGSGSGANNPSSPSGREHPVVAVADESDAEGTCPLGMAGQGPSAQQRFLTEAKVPAPPPGKGMPQPHQGAAAPRASLNEQQPADRQRRQSGDRLAHLEAAAGAVEPRAGVLPPVRAYRRGPSLEKDFRSIFTQGGDEGRRAAELLRRVSSTMARHSVGSPDGGRHRDVGRCSVPIMRPAAARVELPRSGSAEQWLLRAAEADGRAPVSAGPRLGADPGAREGRARDSSPEVARARDNGGLELQPRQQQ